MTVGGQSGHGGQDDTNYIDPKTKNQYGRTIQNQWEQDYRSMWK